MSELRDLAQKRIRQALKQFSQPFNIPGEFGMKTVLADWVIESVAKGEVGRTPVKNGHMAYDEVEITVAKTSITIKYLWRTRVVATSSSSDVIRFGRGETATILITSVGEMPVTFT